MCKASFFLLALLFLGGCFRSTLGGDVIVDEAPDAQPEGQSDVQEITDEAGDELDVQDRIESAGDAPTEGDQAEACEFATLVLIPIITGTYLGRVNCEVIENEWTTMFEARVILFRGNTLFLEEILPCVDNGITIESIPPGDYEVAAEAPPFYSGLMKLTLLDPDLPVICNPPECCPPIDMPASPCETTTATMVFCCLDYGCVDCCV
jgi:hypothetical protein